MALMKAFAFQVILYGLYKLFLEQVVEEYLVPDEVTRNCLVGFVGLLCFGIQLYTEKSDEDDAEADENPKANLKPRGEKIAEKSAETAASRENIGSNASTRVTVAKLQATSREIATEKMSSNDKQVGNSRERSSAVRSNEAEKVTEVVHSGVFGQFSSNMSDAIPNVIRADRMGEAALAVQPSFEQETITIDPVLRSSAVRSNEAEKVTEVVHSGVFGLFSSNMSDTIPNVIRADRMGEAASAVQPSLRQEKITIDPVLNGLCVSETNACDESDEDEIEIDQFVTRNAAEKTKTVRAEGVIEPKDVIEEAKQLRTAEAEVIKHYHVTEAVMESECLTAENISPTRDSEATATLKIYESAAEITNGTAEESLNSIDSLSSKIIKEIHSKELVKDEDPIEANVFSCPEECAKDIADSSPSEQEMNNTSSTSTKTVNGVETMNTNIEETLTLDETTTSLPFEKSAVSSTRQKRTTSGDVLAPLVTIDISFIYACH